MGGSPGKHVLEFVWLDSGERALSEAFDRERVVILEGGHRGYILRLRTVSFLHEKLQHGMEYAEHTRTADGHPVLLLAAALWGVPLVTDTLFPEPTQQLPDNVLVWTF
jgi:hypothetical protein